MKYQRLKNLVVLVTAAAYFAATFLGQKMKLRILCEKLLIISQRFFRHPTVPILRAGRWNQEHPLPKQPRPTGRAASQSTTGTAACLGRAQNLRKLLLTVFRSSSYFARDFGKRFQINRLPEM